MKTQTYQTQSTLIILLFAISFSSCRKNKTTDETPGLTNAEVQNLIINDLSKNVYFDTYKDLEIQLTALYTNVLALNTTTNQANLDKARLSWKNARSSWELSEAFLFGPASTDNIDPSTDTWPVDYVSLDSLMGSTATFTQIYMNDLGDELKGYHPTEYLLWGQNGSKLPSEFTTRQLEYLVALAADLQLKATQLRSSWDLSVSNNYVLHLVNAGNSTSIYSNQRAVFEEILGGMIGICEEVANGKIGDPFTFQDPSLEESPFSNNSLVDFKNNIQGIKNVYFGVFQTDGYGINDFLMANNISLHNTIASKIQDALTAFNGVTIPFGEAIISQPTQIQNLIDKINALKEVLEDQALPFLQQKITN